MATFTFNPTSLNQTVSWDTPADWLPAGVPNAVDADVIVPAITSDGQPYDFNIVIPNGTVDFAIHSLTMAADDLTIGGMLSVAAGLTMEAGATLTMQGSLDVGSLVMPGGTISGSGRISSTGTFDNQGEIDGTGLTLDLAGLRNEGTIVGSGLEIDVGAGGISNLSDGTLSLGSYVALGALTLDGTSDITTDAADILLHGPTFATANDGTVHLLADTLQTIAPTGTLTLDRTVFGGASSLAVGGLLQIYDSSLSAPGITIQAGGTVVGGGTITGPIANAGRLIADVPGFAVSSSVADSAKTLVVAGAIGGSGTLEIASLGTIEGGSEPFGPIQLELTGAAGSAVLFDDWNGVLVLDSPTLFTGSIVGFSAGTDELLSVGLHPFQQSDTIVLSGFDVASVTGKSYSGDAAGGTLTLDTTGGSLSLDFVGSYTIDDFVIAAGPQPLSNLPPSIAITEILPCFLAGTRLLTERGEAAVERLAIGDMLRLAGGGSAPIRWIGQRHIDAARHPRPQEVWPVRVRADAFGMGRPSRDLLLSPDHAVFVEDVLIPVRYLVNGVTVLQAPLSSVAYYHVELPRHDIVLAEGLPSESYLDLGTRGAFDNGGGALVLHPDFASAIWQRDACAKLILGGPVLDRVRAQLRAQAGLLGCRSAAPAASRAA